MLPSRLRNSHHVLYRSPFVDLGTIPSMTLVARKMAIARKAVAEIIEVEDECLVKGHENSKVFVQKLEWIESVSQSAGKAAKEAIGILRGIRSDVDQYLKDERQYLKNLEKQRDEKNASD